MPQPARPTPRGGNPLGPREPEVAVHTTAGPAVSVTRSFGHDRALRSVPGANPWRASSSATRPSPPEPSVRRTLRRRLTNACFHIFVERGLRSSRERRLHWPDRRCHRRCAGRLEPYFTTLFSERRTRSADAREAGRLVEDELDRAHKTLYFIRREVERKVEREAKAANIEETLRFHEERELPSEVFLSALKQGVFSEITTTRWRENQRHLARAVPLREWLKLKKAYEEIERVREIDEQLRRKGRLPDAMPQLTDIDLNRASKATLEGWAALNRLIR